MGLPPVCQPLTISSTSSSDCCQCDVDACMKKWKKSERSTIHSSCEFPPLFIILFYDYYISSLILHLRYYSLFPHNNHRAEDWKGNWHGIHRLKPFRLLFFCNNSPSKDYKGQEERSFWSVSAKSSHIFYLSVSMRTSETDIHTVQIKAITFHFKNEIN